MEMRKYLRHFFEESTTAPAVVFRFFVVALILASSSFALLEILSPERVVPFTLLIRLFEQLVLFVFTAEYALRFYAAPRRLQNTTGSFSAE